MTWDAATVRARGLASHLLDRASLLRAAEAGSWTGAVRVLAEHGYPPDGAVRSTAEELERLSAELRRPETVA